MKPRHRRQVICLMGPTAAGKTEVAIRLAELFERPGVDIVSVDSAMVFRGMDIGTAKPEPAILHRFPHALIDVRDPTEAFSVADFVDAADTVVAASLEAGRIPLLVGGTMLYFRAFKQGLAPMPRADPAVRADIAARAADLGWPALHGELAARDPVAAVGMDPSNGRRIERALEVLTLTGRSITEFWDQPSPGASERLACELVEICLTTEPRATLHQRIASRLDAMFEAGFVDEVRALRRVPGLTASAQSMRAVGYRQVWQHLSGEFEHEELAGRVAAATRQLARRQLTWLRGWNDIAATVTTPDEAVRAASQLLTWRTRVSAV